MANMAITLQTSFQTIFRIYETVCNWKQNNYIHCLLFSVDWKQDGLQYWFKEGVVIV